MAKAGIEIREVRVGAGGLSDGQHCGVRVSGTAVGGAFTVHVARVPETLPADRIACSVVAGTGGWYEVTLPTPGLWYLYLRDSQGWSDEYPFWGLIDETNLVGEWLRDILKRHKQALELRIKGRFNAMHPLKQQAGTAPTRVQPEIKQIIYGLEALVEAWPAIVVQGEVREEPYFATGMCRLVTMRFQITAMHWHQDRLTSMLPMITTLGEGIQHILNLPEYNDGLLPTGIPIALAEAPRMSSHEDEADGGWGAEATIEWSCQRTRQQAPAKDIR